MTDQSSDADIFDKVISRFSGDPVEISRLREPVNLEDDRTREAPVSIRDYGPVLDDLNILKG